MSRQPKATAVKQDAKPTLTPKLRFPEFREAEGWKEERLGSLGTFLRGLTYGATDVAETGLLVLRSTNIQGANLVLDKDLVFVDRGCAADLLLQPKDIVICMSNGSKALVGKSAEYKGEYQGDLTVGAFCSLFRPSKQFSKLAFQSEQYAKFVSISIGGGNINNLKNSDLENFGLPVPPSSAEQQKIAECLTTLDEVIAAQSQKLDALKTHKKGLMQQLFPREGETLPRLRFPEFNSPWKVGTIDDLASTVMGNAFKSTDFAESGTQVIRIGNLYQGELQLDRAPVYLSDAQAKENLKFIVNPSDLLMSMTGTVGKRDYGFVIQIPADCEPLLLNQRVMKLAPTHNCHAGFLLQLLKDERLLDNLYSLPGGTKQANLSAQAVKDLGVSYPQKPEQQRIATCLTSLDDLITAHSAKLSALKTHKKGLMQQLFPSENLEEGSEKLASG